MSGLANNGSSLSDNDNIISGNVVPNSIDPPAPVSSSSSSSSSTVPPPSTGSSVKFIDFGILYRKVYPQVRDGTIATVGQFQACMRSAVHGRSIEALTGGMDINYLVSVFRLLGIEPKSRPKEKAMAKLYGSLIPENAVDFDRKRVKEYRPAFNWFISTDLTEEQASLPVVISNKKVKGRVKDSKDEESYDTPSSDDDEGSSSGDESSRMEGGSKNNTKNIASHKNKVSVSSKKSGGESFQVASSILNSTIKPSIKSSGRLNPPSDDNSDPSSSSSDSGSDSDVIIVKKKKSSKKGEKEKKIKNRKNKNKYSSPPIFDSSSSSDSVSESSSSESSGSDSDDGHDALDSKKIGKNIYSSMKVAGSARNYVRDLQFRSDRNEKEAMSLALACDAMVKDNPKVAFEIITRRLAGVIMADRTGNWSHSSAIEWKNTDGVPLSHKLLKFFDRRAKAFETNATSSRSSNRRNRQFANNGGGRALNRNNYSRSNNFSNNNQPSSSSSSSAPRNNNSFRGANNGRSGHSGAAPNFPSA